MATVELNAQPRSVTGRKVKRLRAQGWIPAVVYGANKPSQAIQVNEHDMERALRQAGYTQLVTLRIQDGNGATSDAVLVREVQRHPVRRHLLHVDFYRVTMTEKLRAEVPVHIVGEAPATTLGAILVQNMSTVEVECLPADIPESIEVDISGLADAGQSILVSDLSVPDGVEIVSDPNETVVSVVMSRAVASEVGEEEEIVEEPAITEPEVIGKGKAAEEEEEEAEESEEE
ncbi:MAG: 50S ribosomal protein L25 [Chloroflexi bacterium]|nr:50S ribosomal protein L25 [Chloroflexota bacterium]